MLGLADAKTTFRRDSIRTGTRWTTARPWRPTSIVPAASSA